MTPPTAISTPRLARLLLGLLITGAAAPASRGPVASSSPRARSGPSTSAPPRIPSAWAAAPRSSGRAETCRWTALLYEAQQQQVSAVEQRFATSQGTEPAPTGSNWRSAPFANTTHSVREIGPSTWLRSCRFFLWLLVRLTWRDRRTVEIYGPPS